MGRGMDEYYDNLYETENPWPLKSNLHDEEIQLMKEIIKVAAELARSSGHKVSCDFFSCSCGMVNRQRDALGDFWRLYRQYNGEG